MFVIGVHIHTPASLTVHLGDLWMIIIFADQVKLFLEKN